MILNSFKNFSPVKNKMFLFIYFLIVVQSDKRCPDPETFEDCVNENLDSLYDRFTMSKYNEKSLKILVELVKLELNRWSKAKVN